MTFFDDVYGLCKEIPRGKVSTYGEIAKKMGTKAYQLVGQALRNNPYAPEVPCHRVVDSKGHLHGFGGKTDKNAFDDKAKLLIEEGVEVKDDKIVNFEKVLYKFK
jgi:methylated-DNA-[protein]-cysteine S-methyltransferase